MAGCEVVGFRKEVPEAPPPRGQIYGVSVDDLNDWKEENAVFHFNVSGRPVDDSSTAPLIALGDTGANCNVAAPHVVALWEQQGCVVQSQRVKAMPIKVAGQVREALDPIVRRVKVRLKLHLDGYDVNIEEWVCEWSSLAENFILSYGTLKRHYLLAYMQTHIAPMCTAPEEIMLDELQAPPPRADEFVPHGTELTDEELTALLDDTERVNPAFPLLEQLKSILRKYGKRLFSPRDTKGLDVRPASFTVKPNVDMPRAPCRFVGRHILPHLEFELNKLLNVGIIRRRTGQAICCSPLCIAAKADGYIRVAVDYRDVNIRLIGSALPIPQMQLLFGYFRGCEWFAGLDALEGYFQHPIEEESKHLTCFITPFGLFEFNFLPMGMAPSPGIFSAALNDDILKDAVRPLPPIERKCVNFIDDTGIGGSTAEIFLERLECVLRLFWERNARLKFKKSTFGFQSLEYCGHVFTPTGYHLSHRRKQGIVDMPIPRTLKQTRSFIGFCQFFAKFTPRLATLLAPITDLTTQASKQFVFTDEAMEAFKRVKAAILAAGQLHHIEEGGQLILFTDASVDGVGGFLVQNINGELRPIAYISHKFSKVAAKWSTIEQEGYAVVP